MSHFCQNFRDFYEFLLFEAINVWPLLLLPPIKDMVDHHHNFPLSFFWDAHGMRDLFHIKPLWQLVLTPAKLSYSSVAYLWHWYMYVLVAFQFHTLKTISLKMTTCFMALDFNSYLTWSVAFKWYMYIEHGRVFICWYRVNCESMNSSCTWNLSSFGIF